MVSFFERRAREEAGTYSQSQGSQGEKGSTDIIPAFDKRHHEYTERDEVLQILLERSEEKKTASTTGSETSSGKMRWVSKWDFTFDKTEKLEPTPEEETTPTKKVKSTTKKSAVKTSKVKSEQKGSLSPKTSKVKSEETSQK